MTKNIKKVAIVIPFYKTSPSKDEEISIKHLTKFLKKYDKFLVLPDSIKNVSFKIPGAKIVNFSNKYFTSVKKYSELLTTKIFYEKFSEYEYILIYQLDALGFSNQLIQWCDKGYDYIGAPFFNPMIGGLSYKLGDPVSGGNGGFSLRKVSSFIKVIDHAEDLATKSSSNQFIRKLWFIKAVLTCKSHKIWLNAPPKDYPFNEDGFWSYEAVKYYPKFRVAPFKEALKFSFERFPRKCLESNNNQIPFGCHAWTRYDRNFWEKYLLSRN